MARRASAGIMTTLWQLDWKEERIACSVYRTRNGMELRLVMGARTLLSMPFELSPRMLARTQSLKRSLKRRGWKECARPEPG